jgi:predicted dehydrogenase
MTRIGLIGFGYWGPNLARNFNTVPGCRLTAIADLSPKRRELARRLYPHARVVSGAAGLIRARDVDAVAIAAPVSAHYSLARAALLAGKHVWIEKPMTTNLAHARELVELADRAKRVLMVDHTMLFSSVVNRIRSVVASGELGKVYYYDAVRINLGLFQHDVNVIWDLAPHDFSIMEYVLGVRVRGVSALSRDCVGTRVEDMAYLTLHCEGGLLAHFHLNWLSPVKIRRVIIGGSRKMLLWDEQNPDEKLRIYDKGVMVKAREEGLHRFHTSYRIGGMHAPVIESSEPLANAVSSFSRCIEKGTRPLTDGRAGARMVGLLEAADRSARRGGAVESVVGLSG